MKTTIFSYFVLLSAALFNGFANAAGASSFNGVSPQKPLKSTNNKNPAITHRYSADPGVMVYKDRVYVYASNDGLVSNRNVGENKYDQINTINCMSSADLVNWMDHGPIAAAGNNGPARWAKNSWAPTAAWKTINGKDKFFLYFANSGSGIGVLTADSPTGPFKDPLGKALITPQTPNCSTITWLFDPAVFVDNDGTGYLYFGGGVPQGRSSNPQTVRVVKLGSDMISLAGTPITIDAPWVFEDSGIHKMGNTYYYSYCTNWDNGPYGNARIAYMTSSSPTGPFTYKGTCFNNPGDFFGTVGNNHHTIISFKNKYYIFYHAQWLEKQVFGSTKGYRTTHVDEMPTNNGSLGNAKGTLSGVTQLQNVDGSALNYANSFAWQAGISVSGQSYVTTVNYSRGAWTGVSQVNLGNASKITIKASSQSGATIKIAVGSESGQAIGYVDIDASSSMKEYTGTLSGASGVKNLFFIASGNCSIESWTLGDGTSSSSNSGNSSNTSNNSSVQKGTPTTNLSEGWYYIRNPESGLYLQVENDYASNGANVEIGDFTGSAGQKWKIAQTSDGFITFTNGLGNYNLDISGGQDEDFTNIDIASGSSEYQKFGLIKSNNNNQAFIIASKVSNGQRAIDVYDFGTTPGSNVHYYALNAKTNQDWIFEVISNSSNTSNNSGNNSGNTSNNSGNTSNNSGNNSGNSSVPSGTQKGTPTTNLGEGWYYIRNPESGLYLQASNDANVEINKLNISDYISELNEYEKEKEESNMSNNTKKKNTKSLEAKKKRFSKTEFFKKYNRLLNAT